MRRLCLGLLVVGSLGLAQTSFAHIELVSPPPRTVEQKTFPCGGSGRANVSYLKPGQTITVQWKETIDHPGHFRIAFDTDGTDGFINPPTATYMDGGPGILVDGIGDKAGGTYTQQITLPNVECTNCTLQVIQVMTDKPPYTAANGGGDDIYYQCADLVLSQDASAPPVVDASASPDGGTTTPDPDGEPGDTDTDASSVSGTSTRRTAAPADEGCSVGLRSAKTAWLSPLIVGVAALLRWRRRRAR